LSKKDVVSILCTSPARLNRAFKDIQRSDSPMMIGRDFDDIDGTRYYSLSGFVALSKELGDKLTMKDRREWCKAVKVTGQKTLRQIADAADRHSKAVEKAKNRARERDNEVCQITGKKYESYQDPPMRFAVHHIFSEAHYPHLATSLDNLITVSEALHTEFHAWNGGTNAPCDADKLIDFVCERYPEYQENALERLYQVRKVFGTQAPTTPPKRLKQKKAS
jgi:hypothetical protein